MRGIAYRRHQSSKKKSKAKKIAHEWNVKPTGKRIGMLASTPKPCSCCICGNPRKHFKRKTIQELKADESFSMERGQDGNADDC